MTEYKGTKKQYIDNHRINTDGLIERRCTDCGEWKLEDTDNFYMMKKSEPERGFKSICKKCDGKRARKWTLGNWNKYKESHKKHRTTDKYRAWHKKANALQTENRKIWYENNPDKIRQYGLNHRNHDITTTEWNACLKTFDYKCAYCGISEEESKKVYGGRLHKEHVIYDGYNDLRNAVPACKSCNSKKHQYLVEDWFPKQLFYTEEKLQFIYWWITEGFKPYLEEKLPYKIIKKRNEDGLAYHHELWSVDEKRNTVELIEIKDKKNELNIKLY